MTTPSNPLHEALNRAGNRETNSVNKLVVTEKWIRETATAIRQLGIDAVKEMQAFPQDKLYELTHKAMTRRFDNLSLFQKIVERKVIASNIEPAQPTSLGWFLGGLDYSGDRDRELLNNGKDPRVELREPVRNRGGLVLLEDGRWAIGAPMIEAGKVLIGTSMGGGLELKDIELPPAVVPGNRLPWAVGICAPEDLAVALMLPEYLKDIPDLSERIPPGYLGATYTTLEPAGHMIDPATGRPIARATMTMPDYKNAVAGYFADQIAVAIQERS